MQEALDRHFLPEYNEGQRSLLFDKVKAEMHMMDENKEKASGYASYT
jgi:hypothetical protein